VSAGGDEDVTAKLHSLFELQLVMDAFEVTAASILPSAQFILLCHTQTFMKGLTIEIISVTS